MHRAIILEDHEDTRTWLETMLSQAFADIEIQAVSSIAQAREMIGKERFDLALVDLNLPDGTGIDIIRHIRQVSPQTFCLVVTVFDDDQYLFPALESGADGYLLKGQSSKEFISSLQGIFRGEAPISPSIARKMISHFHKQPPDKENMPDTGLSKRETGILQLIASGLDRNETAKMLHISPHTVASHLKVIYRKLNVSSRAEATLEALRLGLISLKQKNG